MDLRGRWALVTGASSGLGREIARDLAVRQGANLILVARRAERLRALQDELSSTAGIAVRTVPADLAQLSEVDRVFDESTADVDVYAVVLNAGVTYFGHHSDLDWADFERMLAINVTGVTRLVSRYIPYLVAQGKGGGLMLVTSLAGLVPTPFQSAYSGTKAYLTTFGLGMYHELSGVDVSLTTFAPGGITTEMTEENGLQAHFERSGQMMDARVCARCAVDAMIARRYLSVPGLLNRVQAALPRLVPRKLVGSVLAQAYRRALLARPLVSQRGSAGNRRLLD